MADAAKLMRLAPSIWIRRVTARRSDARRICDKISGEALHPQSAARVMMP
jgi:hypothetical protein